MSARSGIDPGSHRPNVPRDWSVCDICESKDDVQVIEERIRWGKAVRSGWGTGYSGRPLPWCKACRQERRSHSFKYSRPDATSPKSYKSRTGH